MIDPTIFSPRISPRIEPMEDGGSPVIVWLASHLATAAVAGLLMFLVMR